MTDYSTNITEWGFNDNNAEVKENDIVSLVLTDGSSINYLIVHDFGSFFKALNLEGLSQTDDGKFYCSVPELDEYWGDFVEDAKGNRGEVVGLKILGNCVDNPELLIIHPDNRNLELVGVEVGVFVSPENEDFDYYANNNPELPFGFYDESQYVVGRSSFERAREDVLTYVKNGVEGTYGILSEQDPADDGYLFNEFIGQEIAYEFDYSFFRDKKCVLYSVCKKDGEIVEEFLEAALDELEKNIIVENGNKYILTGAGFESPELDDVNNIDSFVGSIECCIPLKCAPNSDFERLAKQKDGENYSSECFFLSATVSKDNVQDDWCVGRWELYYTDNLGNNIFLDDTAELMGAWEYFKKEVNPFAEYKPVKDLIVDAAEKSSVGSDKTVSEPEHSLD